MAHNRNANRPHGAAARMRPDIHRREVQKQDFRKRAAEIGGSVRDGYVMLKGEGKPETISRRVDAEIKRWLAEKRKAGTV